MKQGEDELLAWCAGRMERVRGPQSARELVDGWYSYWHGRDGKPPSCYRDRRGQFKTHHTERVAKWLLRLVRSGKVVCVDRDGPYGAKRYRLVEGQRLTGIRRKPLASNASDA